MEKPCTLCPRKCKIDRSKGETGLCRSGNDIVVARSMVHMWEEPPISGTHGSGAIFFSGCSLRCVFCQNRPISHDCVGKVMSESELGALMLELQEKGVHNINLVTPTHFADKIASVLEKVKPRLNIPVVYNCGGYESKESVQMLKGLVDIYLPDFKYASDSLAVKYSNAPKYSYYAAAALAKMVESVGRPVFFRDTSGEEIMKSGVIVRHLVLPSSRRDSMEVLDIIAKTVGVKNVRLSLMSQYTPEFALNCNIPCLHRKVTSFEYNSVLDHAEKLGFEGYFQDRSSACTNYTPEF